MRILTGAAMQGLAEPVGRIDRPAVFLGKATRLWLSVKGLFRLTLRQAIGMVRALLKPTGLDGPLPDGTALCRRPKTPTVRMPCLCVGGPLNLPADRTGISFPGDGERHARNRVLKSAPRMPGGKLFPVRGKGLPLGAGRGTATCVSPAPERRSHKGRLHPHNAGQRPPQAGWALAGGFGRRLALIPAWRWAKGDGPCRDAQGARRCKSVPLSGQPAPATGTFSGPCKSRQASAGKPWSRRTRWNS
ncbi:MAG: transposase [Rhodobacter sp.]|nr:transposase [Rhodobacter sp.]